MVDCFTVGAVLKGPVIDISGHNEMVSAGTFYSSGRQHLIQIRAEDQVIRLN